MATKKPQDVPSHYHAISTMTKGWKAYSETIKAHATRTPAQRAESDREEQRREVHVTGTPHSQKGG